MNEKEEGLFGVCNEAHIVVIWVLVFVVAFAAFLGLEKTNDLKKKIKNLEKKVEESLDNKPIEIKIEGSWEQFGKLTFSDSVLTKDD